MFKPAPSELMLYPVSKGLSQNTTCLKTVWWGQGEAAAAAAAHSCWRWQMSPKMNLKKLIESFLSSDNKNKTHRCTWPQCRPTHQSRSCSPLLHLPHLLPLTPSLSWSFSPPVCGYSNEWYGMITWLRVPVPALRERVSTAATAITQLTIQDIGVSLVPVLVLGFMEYLGTKDHRIGWYLLLKTLVSIAASSAYIFLSKFGGKGWSLINVQSLNLVKLFQNLLLCIRFLISARIFGFWCKTVWKVMTLSCCYVTCKSP